MRPPKRTFRRNGTWRIGMVLVLLALVLYTRKELSQISERASPPATVVPDPGVVRTVPASPSPGADGTGVAAPAGTERVLDAARLVVKKGELESDPNMQLVCELSLPIREAEGYLAVGGHSDINGRVVQVVEGKAYIPYVYSLPPGPTGEVSDDDMPLEGILSIAGYGPVKIRWGEQSEGGGRGACAATVDLQPGTAAVTGTVTLQGTKDPATGAWVEGCGNLARLDPDGSFYMEIVSERCSLLAMRQDGALRSMTPPVDITPTPGHDVVVDLVLPDYPRAGLGLQVKAVEGGILVEGVIEGGGAGEAGLATGDLIVAVDGETTADLDLGEFVEIAGGREDSEVTLVVVREGEQREIAVVRKQLL